jgi:hypothetical protein
MIVTVISNRRSYGCVMTSDNALHIILNILNRWRHVMTKLNTENRELAIEELEIVAGGVTEGGCIRPLDILKLLFPKLPQPAPSRDPFAIN